MASKDNSKKIDSAGLMKKLVAGFKTKPTKRGGKTGFTLVQSKEGRTLGMASIRASDGAVKLKGARLDKTLRLESAADVTAARKRLDAIAKSNEMKVTTARVKNARAKAAQAKASKPKAEPTLSGERARTRQRARSGVQVEA